VGGAFGALNALGMQYGVGQMGITMSLGPGVLAVGFGAVVFMCALASVASVRKVLTVSAAEVFK
jgi:hypothetical protein